MKTDSIFYQLFAVYPASFFELVGLPAAEAQSYRFDSVEVKQTAFRIDGVFLAPGDRPSSPTYYVEIQFQSDPDLYKRLFSEIFLHLRYDTSNHPWRAVVYQEALRECCEEGIHKGLHRVEIAASNPQKISSNLPSEQPNHSPHKQPLPNLDDTQSRYYAVITSQG
ncbi:MAG: DUF2887 domain-containing protein [Synechococcus sp.]